MITKESLHTLNTLLCYHMKYVFKKSPYSRTVRTNCHTKCKLPYQIQ